MIANIIATIMMALGVVSGTKATSNTFYDESHTKPIQRASETITNTYYYEQKQEYYPNGYQHNNVKWYLCYEQNGTINKPIVESEYYNIYNTTYRLWIRENNLIRCKLISLFKITTYFNFGSTNIKISQEDYFNINNLDPKPQLLRQEEAFITDTNIDEAIDQTLTESTITRINNIVDNANKIDRYYDYHNYGNNGFGARTETTEYVVSSIQENQTKNVVMVTEYDMIKGSYEYEDLRGSITPKNMVITGTAALPTINYEIVDIPNVMYTVLTMPFSFISTAFNLTVFSGTPYALNFGNLFLTIVAIFILLWLIKKVFH